MTRSGTVAPAPAAWSELWALATRPDAAGGQRVVLERALDHWRQARGAAGAALYVHREGALRRELEVGEGSFPERVEGPPAGLAAQPLPGGLLLGFGVPEGCAGSPEGAPESGGGDPLTVLLATGLHALRLERQLKEKHFQANYRGVELEALYDVGLAIASTLDLERLTEEILLRAVSLLDARRGALYLVEDGHYRLDRTFGGEAPAAFPVDDPTVAACLDGAAGPADLLPGVRYLLAVPVESDGRRRGALLVGDKESRSGVGPFTTHDRRTLALFANQAAIALENARLHRQALEKERLERELDLAAEIQRQILPDRLPQLAGFDLAGWNRPARQVGGDYYDLVALEEGRLGLALGDVSGKGMPAALMVATLHSALKLLRDRSDLGPRLLERLNRHLYESSAANKFITLIVGELETASGRLTYLNAGHNPGILLRAGGAVERLEASGVPLGLMAAAPYHSRVVTVEPGDLLCFFSDGITECASPADEEFGDDRLIEFLTARRGEPLDDVIAGLDLTTREFSENLPQGDDQTVVLLRRQSAG